MAASLIKCFFILALVVLVEIATLHGANAAGECPRSTPDKEALKLAPCASAAQNPKAKPTSGCCAQVMQLGRNPKCLCAVMLSNTAKRSGVKPQIAMTIPKRCNIAKRPVGYKCGPYRLP
ncbi:protease inhibitor/seed storage/LTP family protein [Acinetobacter baumannii]